MEKLTQEQIELLRDQSIAHVVEMQNQLKAKIRKHVQSKFPTREQIDFCLDALIEAEKANQITWNIPDVPSK